MDMDGFKVVNQLDDPFASGQVRNLQPLYDVRLI